MMQVMRRGIWILVMIHLCAQAVAQVAAVTVSGVVRDRRGKTVMPYVSVVLTQGKDSTLAYGTVTDAEGRYELSGVKPGTYVLVCSFAGYATVRQPLYVGSLSAFLSMGVMEMDEHATTLSEIVVGGKQAEVGNKLDKKVYTISDNIAQAGGSVLQALQNLPGVTVLEGKLQLRGSDKLAILIDGKQTALTGFGSQTGLDNIPASSIERIEIINNPSARYDANGNAGIINIIMKKNRQEGFNGKVGLAAGLGALWVRKENLPGIRPQYVRTPKLNPSIALNYRKKSVNVFLQADDLYTQTLNKNEFVVRTYDDGTVISQQLKRNRNTNFFNTKAGVDLYMDNRNTLTLSGLFGSEKIIDRGDQPFYNEDHTEQLRLWQFLEDELKTTVMGSAAFQHRFRQPGQVFNAGFNYTFHREDEKYFYDNTLPASTGTDAFALISDEQVYDLNLDYVQPLKYGRLETGLKLRNRLIPTNMQFIPGANSVLDSGAGGRAVYKELIPAVYGNYFFENERWESELGLRMEYVRIRYDVNPDHNTYKSDGYQYTQPFPSLRVVRKIDEKNRISFFYNRRVDRPNEVDIRIFPKYDDAEIIKVGNPALRPQFTNSFELGYKTSWARGYLYAAAYYKMASGTITRISTTVPGSKLIYAIFQNAGRSHQAGMEMVLSQKTNGILSFNVNGNLYYNQINAFEVENLYPEPHPFSAPQQNILSGNLKVNASFRFPRDVEMLVTAVYLAPDVIPQGKVAQRFSLDLGVKKPIQKGKGEVFANVTDLFNSMVIRKTVQGNGFSYTSADYYETQVIRVGYSYKF